MTRSNLISAISITDCVFRKKKVLGQYTFWKPLVVSWKIDNFFTYIFS
ncbi:hypothetical protein CAEBREN_25414 [Caenorhabditis brenneri]|uniref:Uncharacterized protein n=1 Tax=Caenorhabditis brenneri TaxID=135651 RepID=G0ND44_CAEBE|nr:hypothetical protein CAEBREN_25414 [Caenorhabditis brenneri]